MSKSNSFENAMLLLTFNNTNIANIGDATGLRGSSAAGNLYFAAHTSDPAEAGDQTTNEATYVGYTRIAVVRGAGGWTITGSQAQNTAVITLPPCTGGTNVLTHFSIGTLSSGAGMILYKGTLTPNLTVNNGITPQIPVNGATITED